MTRNTHKKQRIVLAEVEAENPYGRCPGHKFHGIETEISVFRGRYRCVIERVWGTGSGTGQDQYDGRQCVKGYGDDIDAAVDDAMPRARNCGVDECVYMLDAVSEARAIATAADIDPDTDSMRVVSTDRATNPYGDCPGHYTHAVAIRITELHGIYRCSVEFIGGSGDVTGHYRSVSGIGGSAAGAVYDAGRYVVQAKMDTGGKYGETYQSLISSCHDLITDLSSKTENSEITAQ